LLLANLTHKKGTTVRPRVAAEEKLWAGVTKAPPASGGQEGVNTSRRAWTGWVSVPGSFFCGTVVPASQLSNPQLHSWAACRFEPMAPKAHSGGTRVVVLPYRNHGLGRLASLDNLQERWHSPPAVPLGEAACPLAFKGERR
jgi:hypothetical protein